MENSDTRKLLQECDAGAKMAVTSIDEVLEKVCDSDMKHLLQESKKHHEKLGNEIHSLLDRCDTDEKDPSPMAKGMSWLKTNMKLGMDNSDATVADLITDGCNMGIKSLNKYLNEYEQADSSAKEALVGDDATKENKDLAASFSKMQEVADYNSAVMNLESGAVDAICMDIGVAKYQTGKHKSLTILDQKISSEGYGVGFYKGNTKLRDQVQETLNEMAADGTVDKIAQKYADYNLPECVCIGKNTDVKETTSAQKEKVSKNTDSDTAQEEHVGFVGKMKQGFANFGNITKQLCKGFGATLSIFFLTMIISLPLGLLVTFGRMTKITPIRWITKIYISIMRGTPLMLQLLVVFFGPYYLFGIKLASTVPHYRFIAVIIGFSLNYAAYFAEIYRSGIESIPAGQREAAKLLGYTRGQTFAKIILPQMIKRVMPPVTNEIITLVKDTSLAFVLSYMEMFTMAQQIAATLTNVMPIFVAGVFYYIFNYLVAFVMELIEKKLNYYQ